MLSINLFFGRRQQGSSARYKIETYDIVNLVNGRPEIGRIVHLTFFSKEKGPDGPYHSFVRVILRGTTAIYVKDR